MRIVRTILTSLFVVTALAPSATAQSARRADVPPAPEPPRVQKAPGRATTDAPVNINTAAVKELMTLAGIGQKAAEKIVAYREAHGPFKSPEDLRKVSGVASSVWDKNRTRIVVK
jgi:competence protein ComEA